MNNTRCKTSRLIFCSLWASEDETTTECTCVNDIIAKLQITGMPRYHSMGNWDSFSSSARMGFDCNGPGAQGRSKSPRLDSQTPLLSAYFYHPFHHKGSNYAHFSARSQLPECQRKFIKSCLPQQSQAALRSAGRESKTRKSFFPDLFLCLLHAS